MKRMLHLPDVNIWVALTFDSHPNPRDFARALLNCTEFVFNH